MYTILSFFAGVIGAVTVMQCGQMAAFHGDYSSSVVTHVVGLLAAMIAFSGKAKSLPEKKPVAPWMFLGGVIGVGTVVLNNMAFAGVGVTAIVGLGLLGQSVTSLVIDQFGLLGAQRNPFRKSRLLGIACVFAGALVMVFPLTGANIGAVLMALTTGLTIVVARTMNSQLAARYGVVRSTVMNYITGLTTSAVVLILLGRSEPMMTDFHLSPNWFMYTAGALGVVMTVILNVTVSRIPAFMFTMLQFTGQMFASLALDAILQGSFSVQSAAGGILVAAGLALNTYMDNKHKAA